VKEYLPYISVVFVLVGWVYAVGKKDKGYSSDIAIIRSKVDDLSTRSIVRVNERVDQVEKDLKVCVGPHQFSELRDSNTRRFDKIDSQIDQINQRLNQVATAISRLEATIVKDR